MSLATRCTHCGTIFKVVQDQLKVSEGWVRCGRCTEVFNALPTLFDLDKEPPPPRLPPQPEPVFAPTAPAEFNGAPAAHTEAAPPFDAFAPLNQPPVPDPVQAFDAAPGFDPANAPPPALPSSQELLEPPPSDWERTLPRGVAAELAAALPPHAPTPSTTEFELDTAVSLPEGGGRVVDDEPLPYANDPGVLGEPLALRQSLSPPSWEAPVEDDGLPSTDEADALDSRYLLPTPRERKSAYQRTEGPEFADAQFPSDALLDDEDDWPHDEPSSATPDRPGAPAAAPFTLPEALTTSAAALAGLRQGRHAPPGSAPLSPPAPPPHAEPPPHEPLGDPAHPNPDHDSTVQNHDDAGATTQPSRFGENFVPEQAVESPSQRQGRLGARGRETSAPTPEFMRRAQRQAFWRHPATRAVLSVLALSLVLTLALQMAHQFRDLLAAYHPPLRPYLAQWCERVGCKLSPPLRLDDLQVESATLVRATSDGADRYRLAVVVHNKAPIDLAWPHIDLTLTDDKGSVIARRAFAPSDASWLDTPDPKAESPQQNTPAASLPTAAPPQRSTTLMWHLRAPDIQPAGYTAELFYP